MKSISDLHNETVARIDAIIDDEVKRIEAREAGIITREMIWKSFYELLSLPLRKCVPVRVYDHITNTWCVIMM